PRRGPSAARHGREGGRSPPPTGPRTATSLPAPRWGARAASASPEAASARRWSARPFRGFVSREDPRRELVSLSRVDRRATGRGARALKLSAAVSSRDG